MKFIPIVLTSLTACAVLSNVPLTVRHEDLGGNITAAHISDLHKRRFGRDNKKLIEKIKRESPDIIFISGDFVSRTETDFSTAIKALEALAGIAPVYMISGNHEQSLPDKEKSLFFEKISRTRVNYLRNRTVKTVLCGREIFIVGIEESYSIYKKNGGYRDLDKLTCDDIISLVGEAPPDAVLLAHDPLFAEEYAKWGAKYVLSGHIHGGAVRLFGVGLLSPERKFFPRYSKGVYTLGKMKLLVSAGLGKLRLFDQPEIVIYRM